MRRASLVLGPALVAGALFACSSDSSSAPGELAGTDGGAFDGADPIDGGPLPGKDATPVDSGPPVITVVVTARTAAKAGITVVWHDATGAVIGTTKTGTDGRTSSAALATTPAQPPAMVSALLGTASGTTEIVTWTGVALGDQLLARDLDDGTTVVGHFDVMLPGDPGNGATQFLAASGTCVSAAGQDPAGNVDIPLTGPCIRNTNSILARATDDQGAVLSYTYLNGKVPLQDGGTVGVTMPNDFADPADVNITALNANGATLTTKLVEIADDLPFPNATGAANGDTTDFKIATGFADAFQMGLFGAPAGGVTGAQLLVGKQAAPGAAFTIDWGQALPGLTTLTSDLTTAGRPKLSWASAATLAPADGGVVSMLWTAGGQKHGWTLVVPPGAANETTGSITAPALPSDATAWAFAAPIDSLDAIFAESDALASYKEFRAAAAVVLPSAHDPNRLADAVLLTSGSLRATELRP